MKKYIIRLEDNNKDFRHHILDFLHGFNYGIECVGMGEKFSIKEMLRNIVIECNDARIIGCVNMYLSNFNLTLLNFNETGNS